MQRKITIPILAAIVGLVLAIGSTAFTKTIQAKPASITYFKFVGSSMSDYFDAAGWQMSPSPFPDCPDDVHACTVSSDTYSTTSTLANFLKNGSSHLNPDVDHGSAYLVQSQRAEF